MFKLSAYIAKLEDRWGKKLGRLWEKHKGKWKLYLPLGLSGWYFYGMLINSIRLGTRATFNQTGEAVDSIWVVNPFRNLLAVFSPTGLAVTLVGALLVCLIAKKGYIWFSGYKYIHDKRGFDILPDGTHGTSGFMSRKEQTRIVLTGSIKELDRTLLGKQKDAPDDDDKYAEYVTLRPGSGLTEHTMIYGATGSGKTRGFVKPFILQTARRKESMVLVDPKGEIYESMSAFLKEEGYEVRMFNLLDMENSDAWNCLSEIEHDKDLVQSIAEVIIKNTSNANERQDFWEKAELNLLMALMHYVASQTVPGTKELLPIQQRSLGAIYRMLSNESFADLERRFEALPKGHPALPPYGIFKLANRQIWGNIAIGLGNRLSVFQNPLVDKITSYNEIDLTLPGKKPCAYFCCISAQDSSLEFLSSLFFSQLFTRLMDYGRRHGDHGRLPVTVNVCLEEFCNIGKLVDFKRVLNVCRGSAIFCQIIVQSIPQLQDRYPKTEWEELIGCTDIQICLGCNDVDTATYISKKCGMVTIKVENNQMPLMPLFSPVYTSTRPYSQTKSNTQRALMLPDEILRMDNRECLVLLRGEKPLRLYKIIPDEHPSFGRLRDVRVAEYIPHWRQEEAKPSAPDGFGHHFWVIDNADMISAITEEFAKIPYLYIADGHHRTAAAALVGNEKARQNPNHTGNEEYNYFLAVAFPASHLNIIDYNRVVRDLNGLTPESFLEALNKDFIVEEMGSEIYHPKTLHNFSLYLGGHWYSLTARKGRYNDSDPIGVLDVTISSDLILRDILGIHDLRSDKRIDFVGGIRGLEELKRRVDSGEMAMALALYPVSMQQLMDIADTGNIMPPKTTWFEPKLRSGLVIHKLDD